MITRQQLGIPEDLARHPDEYRIADEHVGWLVGTGLLTGPRARRFIHSTGIAETISQMAPHGLYPEVLWVTNAASWHLLIREVFEAPDGLRLAEHTEFVRTLVAAIDARTPPSTQWHTAAILCTNALTAPMSHQGTRRYKSHWRRYLLACLENARPASHCATDFTEVLQRRRTLIGLAVLDSAEFLGRYELPEHIAVLPELARYRAVNMELCLLARDLLHLDWERKIAAAHNTVVAYRDQHYCDWADAETSVLDTYYHRRHELQELVALVLDHPAVTNQSLTDQINLRTYLRDLQRAAHAITASHLPSRRHQDPLHTR